MSVEYNVRTGKFALIGKDALGYASDAKALVLSQREIMQVVDLYNKGVFSEIKSENLTVKKVRVIAHRPSAGIRMVLFSTGSETTLTMPPPPCPA